MITNRLILATLAASLLCGCGTLANLDGRKFPLIGQPEERPSAFGGVRRDVGWLSSVSVPENLLFAVDLPVSLAADVVTLPAVKYEQVQWDAEHEVDQQTVKRRARKPDATAESSEHAAP